MIDSVSMWLYAVYLSVAYLEEKHTVYRQKELDSTPGIPNDSRQILIFIIQFTFSSLLSFHLLIFL